MLNQTTKTIIALLSLALIAHGAPSQKSHIAGQSLSDMPVKEVTIFKDGHAFVHHEGQMPVDSNGNIFLDHLPRPVIGTFWAYAKDKNATLTGVLSGREIVSIDRTALSIKELIQANIGATALIKDTQHTESYQATILSIPTRTTKELNQTATPGTTDALPQRGDLVILKVPGGTKPVPLSQITQVTFLNTPNSKVTQEEFRNIMTLKLNWKNRTHHSTANVGMTYLQRGIRWIPSYKVNIDGKGNANIKLQATLINELTDLTDVKAHLVIGVPKFAFKDTPDPISLQQTVAQLSNAFTNRNAIDGQFFSNAIMSQQRAIPSPRNRPSTSGSSTIDLGPEVSGSDKSEDLFLFTLEHITLKKGQRMVIPITQFTMKYEDVYTLDLPFTPPLEVRRNFNNNQQAEMARLYHSPKVMHKIRMTNKSEYPITTAPALILKNDRIIAQGMTTYTAIGATSDLELTTAINIGVSHNDKETDRTPNATKWGGYHYARIDMAGNIKLTNHDDSTIKVEIKRSTLGKVNTADADGEINQLGHQSNWLNDDLPNWWHWHSWPHWWHYMNTVGQIKWTVKIEPTKDIELNYTWNYFWR